MLPGPCAGCRARSASSSTSSRPARLGPIWSSGSLGFSRKNRFVEVSLHRCRIWRSACASTWRATTRIHAPWSGQSPSRKSSKRSVGVERSYPKQLNHYFVKDTTLVSARKPPLPHEICDAPRHFRRGFSHGTGRIDITEGRSASNRSTVPIFGHRRPCPWSCAGRGGEIRR